jgi:opacity protein-like surface antigen
MRSYLLSGACAASMLLALTQVAQAADIDVAPEPMGLGWYVSIFGGWSMADDEEITAADTLGNVLNAEIELDDGFMAGVALGAHFNEWLRAEVEVSGHWHDAKGDAVLTTTAVIPDTIPFDLDGDENALFVLANLWIDLPLDEVIRPYIGGGIGFGRLDLDLSMTDTVGNSYTLIDDSDRGFAYQLGAGVAFDLTENIAVDVGYRYKRINNADLELNADIFTGDLEEDETEKDYKSHNILLGLRLGF